VTPIASWPVEAARSAARRSLRDGGLVATLGFYVVVAEVMGALWRATAGSRGADLAGYDGAELTWYLFTSEALVMCLASRLIERIGTEIADGSITVELLRPAPVLGVRLATELGATVPRLAACLGLGLPLAWMAAGPPPRPWALLLVLPAALLAVACNVVAQHLVAAWAFWVRNTGAVWFLYQKAIFIAGGMLLPLQLLPGPMRAVAWLLPFQAMAYPPARLAAGHVEPWLLLLQAGWLLVLWLVATAAFAAGERRLQVVGG
jgi:ABC-2 type transport system permease protein